MVATSVVAPSTRRAPRARAWRAQSKTDWSSAARYRRVSTAAKQQSRDKAKQDNMAAKPEDIMGDGSILKTIH